MDAIQAITLGVVQGLTEFLPISSTAHLTLVPWFLGWKDPGLTFDVALHVGTLVAVTIYFFSDLKRMAVAWLSSLMRMLGLSQFFQKEMAGGDAYGTLAWLVIAGSVPAVVAGLSLEKWIETTLRSPVVIAATLIGVGILIAIADRLTRQRRDWTSLRLKDAILIGFAQACALVPGVSRSGATITMGLFLGLNRKDAARFSFLLGFPVIFGSTVFKLRHIFDDVALQELAPWMALGALAAAVSGYFCIAFLLRFLASQTMTVFVVYRIGLGVLILTLIARGFSLSTAA
ncbi:MAG: undecaprenyl-diphosphatase UppP [Candidatus Sericytochromatia bacterium]|nr:undecaprenyl-diphosphatase UppP [Candidatus Sericytochromatia bacterium]